MEYIGQYTITDSRLTKDENGRWTSVIRYTQGRSLDNIEWEEASTTSTAFNDEPNLAIAEATFTLMEYLKSYDYTLFESDRNVEDNS